MIAVIVGAVLIALILGGLFTLMRLDLGWRAALACMAISLGVTAVAVAAAILISVGTGSWP